MSPGRGGGAHRWACLAPHWHPAYRRQELGSGFDEEQENPSSRCEGRSSSGGHHENQSTDAGHGGRSVRSRAEGSVMGLDRRGAGGSAWTLSGPTLRRMSPGIEQGRRDVSAAERWEPYEARVSRTVLRGPGGEVPPGYSLYFVSAWCISFWRGAAD